LKSRFAHVNGRRGKERHVMADVADDKPLSTAVFRASDTCAYLRPTYCMYNIPLFVCYLFLFKIPNENFEPPSDPDNSVVKMVGGGFRRELAGSEWWLLA
jgi:hypothetical protein